MKLKKVILARPNSFIVKNMRAFIEDSGYAPTPIKDMEELSAHSKDEIAGFVVSTGVASVVKESYSDVVKKIIERFGNCPIALATMIDVDLTKSTVLRNFNGTLKRDLVSVEEAKAIAGLKADSHIVILAKRDLTDENIYPDTLITIQRLFK